MIFKIINGKAVRYDSGGTDKIDDSTVDVLPGRVPGEHRTN